MLNAGPWSCPFAPHEGQKAWKSGRSQNEGIPENPNLKGKLEESYTEAYELAVIAAARETGQPETVFPTAPAVFVRARGGPRLLAGLRTRANSRSE